MNRMIRSALPTAVLLLSATTLSWQYEPPVDPVATLPIPDFTIPPAEPGTAYERFMVIGDFGTGRADQRKVASAMAKRAKTDGLDFILTTGDNIYPRGVTSADDPQWKTKFEDVYADPALQVSVYPTLGNHDHYRSAGAQVDYSKRNKNWKMPAPHYSFTRTLADGIRVQFFAIDTDPMVLDRPAAGIQLAWLDQEIAKSDARWKIVFGHHPLYSHGPHGLDKKMIARLEPILIRHHVDLYLAAHDHTLEMLKPVKGVHYVISGAGGGPDKAYAVAWTDESFYVATLGGFVFMRISRNDLVIEFVRLDGETQYAYTLQK